MRFVFAFFTVLLILLIGDIRVITDQTKVCRLSVRNSVMLSLSSEACFLSEADSHIQANLEDSVVQQVRETFHGVLAALEL